MNAFATAYYRRRPISKTCCSARETNEYARRAVLAHADWTYLMSIYLISRGLKSLRPREVCLHLLSQRLLLAERNSVLSLDLHGRSLSASSSSAIGTDGMSHLNSAGCHS